MKYGDRRWHFWQYQSDAHIPGISGKVDRNAFFGQAGNGKRSSPTALFP